MKAIENVLPCAGLLFLILTGKLATVKNNNRYNTMIDKELNPSHTILRAPGRQTQLVIARTLVKHGGSEKQV